MYMQEWTTDEIFHTIQCMIERNKAECYCLLVKGLKSYVSLTDKLNKIPQKKDHKIVTLLTPYEENGK